MSEQLMQDVVLPGGRLVSIPVIPGDTTPTWTWILLALMTQPEDSQKTAKDK